MAAEDPQEPATTDKRTQMDELRGVSRAAQQADLGAITASRQPPQRLHHYTTLNGLLGITASHSLWASDVRYMNDASELSYAADFVAEIVTKTVARSRTRFSDQCCPRVPALPTHSSTGPARL